MVISKVNDNLRERLIRWILDSEAQLGVMRGILDDHDALQKVAQDAEDENVRLRELLAATEELRGRAETVEMERESLREETGRLRAELDQCRVELDSCRRERMEIATLVSQVRPLVNDLRDILGPLDSSAVVSFDEEPQPLAIR